MIGEHIPMNQQEIVQLLDLLNRETWVKLSRYPGHSREEISVEASDGRSWRILRPLHFVRLKYYYTPRNAR